MKRERMTIELSEEAAAWLHKEAEKLRIHPEVVIDAMIRDQQSYRTYDDYVPEKRRKHG